MTNKTDKLMVKMLSDSAKLPTKASVGSAGYDLYASHDTLISKHGVGKIDTDLCIAIPLGW